MNISIVIPNYNGEQLLRKNLPKVVEAVGFYREKTKNEVEMIIVDDGSTDSSESVISNFKYQMSNLKFVKNDRNLGFSSTVNLGVKESKGNVIVLLNTDVAPEKDFLAPLIDHFKDPEVFAVGCMDKSIEGQKEVLRGRGIGNWQRGFLVHSRGEVNKNNTLWVSGGSGSFRKSLWDKLGGLNTIYSPFYWEDIDISYRALKSGFKTLFEPKSIVIHEHSIGAIKSKYSDSRVKRIAYRNQIIFVWINVTDMEIYLSHLFWLPYHLLRAVIRLDFYFILGFFDALILFPKIIKSRIRVKKSFIETDKEVISSLF